MRAIGAVRPRNDPALRDVPIVPAQKERPQVPPKCRAEVVFDGRPRGRVQKRANMSTVAFVVTYFFKQKGRPNGIDSR